MRVFRTIETDEWERSDSGQGEANKARMGYNTGAKSIFIFTVGNIYPPPAHLTVPLQRPFCKDFLCEVFGFKIMLLLNMPNQH